MIQYHDISYNGIWLREHFNGNVVVLSTIPKGMVDGERDFEIPILIKKNVMQTIDELNKIFRDKEKRLILKVQSDRYYLASIVGVVEPSSAVRNAKMTLKFHAKDGYGYSVNGTTKVFQNPTEVKLINNGTADTYPVISVEHKADNGYIALVNETGVFAAGSREDVDMDEKPARKILMKSSASFSGKAVTSTPTGDLAGGTLKVATNGEVTLATKGGWGDGKHWAGGFNVFPIDSANAGVGTQRFYSRFQVAAETGKHSQTGLLKVIYMDANNRIVAMYDIHKGSTNKNEADFIMWYGGNSVRRFKTFKFTPSNKERENPFRIKTHGSIDFEKVGAKLRFFWWGKHYDINVPELADVSIAKVGIWIGQYGTRDLITDHYFTVLKLKSMMCEITNSDKIAGVKNLFLAGDTLTVDMGTTDITINDYPRADVFADGGVFLRLPPGESTLYMEKSSWSGDVVLTVEIRERWL